MNGQRAPTVVPFEVPPAAAASRTGFFSFLFAQMLKPILCFYLRETSLAHLRGTPVVQSGLRPLRAGPSDETPNEMEEKERVAGQPRGSGHRVL